MERGSYSWVKVNGTIPHVGSVIPVTDPQYPHKEHCGVPRLSSGGGLVCQPHAQRNERHRRVGACRQRMRAAAWARLQVNKSCVKTTVSCWTLCFLGFVPCLILVV